MFQRLLALTAIATVVISTGCTSLHISRTVSLKGLPPVADSEKLKVVENQQDATTPYQIVGKVTVYRTGTKILKSKSTERICFYSAQIGADGVVGLHRNAGGGLYSGLAVKWLSPGEAVKPKETPFMIALLPIVTDAKGKGDQTKVSEALRLSLVYLLESKGYYLKPEIVLGFNGGIEEVQKLNDASLRALGGNDIDLIMEIAITKTAQVHYIIGAEATATIRTTLYDKTTRKIVLQKETAGAQYNGWLINMMASDDKRIGAAYAGVEFAFRDLKPIHDSSSF